MQLAVGCVDEPAHGGGVRGLAVVRDHHLAGRERAIDVFLIGGGVDERQRRRLADDPPVLRRPVERHDERVGADERPQQQPVGGVVDELEVDVGIVDRRVPAERIVRDVERVVRPCR